jgi:hypothetical protein
MSKEKNLPKLKETKDVPPDDPLKRHENLESDIECGGKGKKLLIYVMLHWNRPEECLRQKKNEIRFI